MREVSRPTTRLAGKADLAAINDIYNHYVEGSTCTFQFEPDDLEAREAWFDGHDSEHPVVVAEIEGEILGWGSLSAFRPRPAYRRTVENSVYVRAGMERRGIGRALLTDLIERARTLGHHTIVAVISADQPASVAFHESLGFTTAGHLREVGCKFGEWLDVIFMQLMLNEVPES